MTTRKWVLITDQAADAGLVARAGAAVQEEIDVVLVSWQALALSRSQLPPGVRCGTHPGELDCGDAARCVVLDGPLLLERHRERFSEVVFA